MNKLKTCFHMNISTFMKTGNIRTGTILKNGTTKGILYFIQSKTFFSALDI